MKDINQLIANLSPAKRSLLEHIIKNKTLKTKLENTISPRINSQDVPLSFSPQVIWLVEQLGSGNLALNRATNISLTGLLNVLTLEESLNEILRRHHILRTIFEEVDGQLFQKVVSSITLKLPVVDFSNFNDNNKETEVQRLVIQ